MDETLIIEGCKQGQAKAQKLLFDNFADAMLVTCTRYVRNPADAEELMLSGFYKFFTQLDKFRYKGTGSIAPWLRKIMINECLMFLRKRGQLILIDERSAEQLHTDETIYDKIDSDILFNSITQLSAGYRTIFNMYVIEGMTHREIAKALNISIGTSKSQLNKARTALQQIIKRNGGYNERFR